MSIHRLFCEHPASVGESYLQHLRMALGFSARLLLAGMACLVHAVFPFLCQHTGSNSIVELHERMLSFGMAEIDLRGWGRMAALYTEAGFDGIDLVNVGPFLVPPIPRVGVLLRKAPSPPPEGSMGDEG